MPDTNDLNPFAAPQSASAASGGEETVHPEAEILQAIESELAKTKFGFWTVSLTCFAIAGFNVRHFVYAMVDSGLFSPGLGNLIGIALHFAFGFLAWQIIHRLKHFSRNTKPWTMNEVFAAHAAFWKFLGIVAMVVLVCLIPMAILAAMFIA